MIDQYKLNRMGYAPVLTDCETNQINVRVETRKGCEVHTLETILRIYSIDEIISAFECANEKFSFFLQSKAGHYIPNWKYALNRLLNLERARV